MERGRTEPDHEDRHEDTGESGAEGKKKYAEGGGTHTHRQTPHERTAVKDVAYDGLEYRSSKLIDKRYQTDFGKIDAEVGFEHRIDCRDDRLEKVVETVGGTEGKKHMESGHLGEPADFLQNVRHKN